MSAVDARSQAMLELVEEGSEVARLATGSGSRRGRSGIRSAGGLTFSDLSGDARRSVTLDGVVTDLKRPSLRCNGVAHVSVTACTPVYTIRTGVGPRREPHTR